MPVIATFTHYESSWWIWFRWLCVMILLLYLSHPHNHKTKFTYFNWLSMVVLLCTLSVNIRSHTIHSHTLTEGQLESPINVNTHRLWEEARVYRNKPTSTHTTSWPSRPGIKLGTVLLWRRQLHAHVARYNCPSSRTKHDSFHLINMSLLFI